MTELLQTEPPNVPATGRVRLILAHGAGAPMTSPFMDMITDLIAGHAIAVTRFEFPYMAGRRGGGKRTPPPKAERLMAEYEAVVDQVLGSANGAGERVFIGGKSMGGRVASMIADKLHGAGKISGLVCLGYPFHPPGKPEQLRTAHLETLRCPALIVQGERDPFGSRAEVEANPLSKAISFAWMGDGDHDFGPRGGSGFTRKGNLAAAAGAVAAFVREQGDR